MNIGDSVEDISTKEKGTILGICYYPDGSVLSYQVNTLKGNIYKIPAELAIINPYLSVNITNDHSCDFKLYIGLTEVYKYCTLCDRKLI